MTDVNAVVRVEHPDIVLTATVAHDRSARVESVSEAGTDLTSGKFFFRIESADFRRFEDGVRNDRTIGEFERVIETRDGEAIYSFEYMDEAKVLSPVVSAANGVILDMENDGVAWILTVWLPDRTELVHLWDYAQQHDVDIELLRVNEYASLGKTDAGLTDSQREALLVALESGYFEEPRNATLSEVAAELDISQPAADGLLRRGIKRLVVSSRSRSTRALANRPRSTLGTIWTTRSRSRRTSTNS
ncbi:helix-turn-helix domain-containing protein [Halobium palmae]|uniref:Helix-turn-helix domain-containing protein n=1 Tax=Halobium palmae TaxID=1776492 RepID=A0ABD5RV74_9EURY